MLGRKSSAAVTVDDWETSKRMVAQVSVLAPEDLSGPSEFEHPIAQIATVTSHTNHSSRGLPLIVKKIPHVGQLDSWLNELNECSS